MDVQYFIEKFEAIPEEKWCVDVLSSEDGKFCANGHCNVRPSGFAFFNHHIMQFSSLHNLTDESRALQKVFSKLKVHYRIELLIDGTITDGWHTGHPPEYSIIAAEINNNLVAEYQQETPKQRILAALRDIQLLEEQNRAVEKVQSIVDEVTPDDIDATVNSPKPRPRATEGYLAGFVTSLLFLLNIF